MSPWRQTEGYRDPVRGDIATYQWEKPVNKPDLRGHIIETPWHKWDGDPELMGSILGTRPPMMLEVHVPRVITVSQEKAGYTDSRGRWVSSLQTEFPQTTKIGLIGKMHSGKSTVSDVFGSNLWDYSAFADEVKEIAVSMVNSETINVMRHLGKPWKPITRADLDADKDRFRQLLQFVGNYGRQTYGDDVWIKIWNQKYQDGYWWRSKGKPSSGPGIYVDDVRYRNEAMFLKNQGFTLIKVERDEKERKASIREAMTGTLKREPKKRELREVLNQPSETEVDDCPVDYIIRNDATLADLRRVASKIIGNPAYKRS